MPTYRIRDQDLQGKIIVLKPPAAGRREEFPDYLTQGETLEELQENLRDL
jgi:hypothetical protein